METKEFWLLISFLAIAITTSLSLVISATYIPFKKITTPLKNIAASFYQALYFILVGSLFFTLVGLGIYIPLSFDLISTQNTAEIVRVSILSLFVIFLFLLTISYKKQTLTSTLQVIHTIVGAFVLVVATQEDTLNFSMYPYVLVILALFLILRYGIGTFNKRL